MILVQHSIVQGGKVAELTFANPGVVTIVGNDVIVDDSVIVVGAKGITQDSLLAALVARLTAAAQHS